MVEDKVKSIIVDTLGAPAENVNLESSIIDDLGADSLDVVDILQNLEEYYGIKVDQEEISDLNTVGDIVEYIENKIED